MIRLKKDAAQTINRLVYSTSIRANYLSVCERYANGYVQMFITDLQMLITKLGIMISEVDLSGINISYCAQSIIYLCKTVLDNPSLVKTFDDIGINSKGNAGKHGIITNNIDMDRAVTTYNNLVNSIAKKYNLPSLANMVVRKKEEKKPVPTPVKKPTPAPVKKVVPTPKPVAVKSKQSTPKPKQPDSSCTCDEQVRLTAELLRGTGRYVKGLFHKVSMLNFQLKIVINNPHNYRIKSVIATFKSSKGHVVQKRIITSERSLTEIDLETEKFSGNISASVVVVYQIGLFKSKQIKTTVSKMF